MRHSKEIDIAVQNPLAHVLDKRGPNMPAGGAERTAADDRQRAGSRWLIDGH